MGSYLLDTIERDLQMYSIQMKEMGEEIAYYQCLYLRQLMLNLMGCNIRSDNEGEGCVGQHVFTEMLGDTCSQEVLDKSSIFLSRQVTSRVQWISACVVRGTH